MKPYEKKYYEFTHAEGRWDGFPGKGIVAYINEHLGAGGEMLDLGCGTAGILEYLPEEINYTGIDASLFALEEARRRWNSRLHTIFFANTSLARFSDGQFDLILLFYSLEHLREPRETLRECRRALKQGGSLIIAAPNLEFPFARPNALRNRSGFYRIWFTMLRSFDYIRRIFGIYSFRVLGENFTSHTGRYELKDDDLWHMASSWEVIKFLGKQGFGLIYFWKEREPSGMRRAFTYLPTLCWYGMPLVAAFIKK